MMKMIKPSVEIITEPDLYKRIEIAARTCYKSEDKITDDSAKKMVKALIRRGHESPLEHSFISIECSAPNLIDQIAVLVTKYELASGIPHFVKFTEHNGAAVFAANLRAWRSICWFHRNNPLLGYIFYCHYQDLFSDVFDDIVTYGFEEKYGGKIAITENAGTDDVDTIVTARFVCDRGVSHELVRHRLLAISQESTRYCNYGNGVTFVEPWWWPEQETSDTQFIRASCQAAEDAYTSLIASGASPQKARAVLPNMLKTEVVATGTVEYWRKYILPLRLSKAAHPDIRRVMEMFCHEMNWNPDDFRKGE